MGRGGRQIPSFCCGSSKFTKSRIIRVGGVNCGAALAGCFRCGASPRSFTEDLKCAIEDDELCPYHWKLLLRSLPRTRNISIQTASNRYLLTTTAIPLTSEYSPTLSIDLALELSYRYRLHLPKRQISNILRPGTLKRETQRTSNNSTTLPSSIGHRHVRLHRKDILERVSDLKFLHHSTESGKGWSAYAQHGCQCITTTTYP